MSMLDELKKVGLTNDKKAKQVERAKKQQQHHELKTGEAKKTAPKEGAPSDAVAEVAPALVAKDQEQLERLYKDAGLANFSGRKKFYFTTPEGFIDCMCVSDVAYILLERGKIAIVANASKDDFILVKRATALAIEALDKTRVVMLHRQEV